MCIAQGSSMPTSYTVKDIYFFNKNRFPVIFLFKTINEIEDFAIGWKRLTETTPLPVSTEPGTESPSHEPFQEGNALLATTSAERKEKKKEPKVNPMAETILDFVSQFWIAIGWIISISLLIVGFILGFELCDEEWYGVLIGLVFGTLAGGLSLITYYFLWATVKIVINISNNLYRIDEKLGDLLKKN